MTATRHRLITGMIYYLVFGAGLFVTASCAMLGGVLVDGEWGFGAALVGMFLGLGVVLWAFRIIRRKRRDSFFRLTFQGYAGNPVPAGNLLSIEAPDGVQSLAAGHYGHMIADGGDALFVIQHGRSRTPHDVSGGKIVSRPGGSEALAIPYARLHTIEVIEISDEQIAAAAVDDRDYSERLMLEGITHLMGVKTKTKIIPFAAYLRLTADGHGGQERLLFAFPTEINDETLKLLGFDSNDDANAMIESAVRHALDKGKDVLVDEGRELASATIGQGVVDQVDSVVGWYDDIKYWTDIGAAQIGSTKGARGQLWARLTAEKLRQISGLPNVVVHQMADLAPAR